MTKLDLGGTPKKKTRFTVMLSDKIYAGFCKNLHSKPDGCLYAGQIELLQRKLGLNYTIPTLTSYTEKLRKKCTESCWNRLRIRGHLC